MRNCIHIEGDAWRGMLPLPSLNEREENPMEEIWKDIEGFWKYVEGDEV